MLSTKLEFFFFFFCKKIDFIIAFSPTVSQNNKNIFLSLGYLKNKMGLSRVAEGRVLHQCPLVDLLTFSVTSNVWFYEPKVVCRLAFIASSGSKYTLLHNVILDLRYSILKRKRNRLMKIVY